MSVLSKKNTGSTCMPEQVTLYWHYKPTPDIKAPYRIISEDVDIQRPLLGMLDEERI